MMTNISEAYDGNKLFEMCSNGEAFFGGYITGLVDADHHNFSDPLYCIPKGVTVSQAYDVLCKYLRNAPEERHEEGAWLARRALIKAWPCSRKGDRER